MLWTDLLSGKKNAAAMQFYKRYNAMLLKQMYVEYEKGGKTKKQMKKKKKGFSKKPCHVIIKAIIFIWPPSAPAPLVRFECCFSSATSLPSSEDLSFQ